MIVFHENKYFFDQKSPFILENYKDLKLRVPIIQYMFRIVK